MATGHLNQGGDLLLSWISSADAKDLAETVEAIATALAIIVGGAIAWRRFAVAGGGYGARCDLQSEIATEVVGQDVVIVAKIVARNPGAANLRLDTTDPASGLIEIRIVDDAILAAVSELDGSLSEHNQLAWSAAEIIIARAFRHTGDPTQWRVGGLEAGQQLEENLALTLRDSAGSVRAIQMAITIAAQRRKMFRWQPVEYWTHVASTAMETAAGPDERVAI